MYTLRTSIGLKTKAFLLGSVVVAGTVVHGRAKGQQGTSPGPPPTVFQVGTQLVPVDIVVQDKDGHPIHGLTADMFHVTENGVAQSARHFDEHTNTVPDVNGPEIPKLPAGTFTDYTPVAPDSTLNILLVDSLNTPANAQSYLQTQLKDFIKHAKPGTRIAIFGLANNLVLLQGFTSDLETLQSAINHKLIPRYSSLLDDPGGSGVDQETASDLAADSTAPAPPTGTDPNLSSGSGSAAANFQQFEAETAAIQTQMRTQRTLDALNALAHYLATFSGRKNLIWFSGSFPLNVLPNPALQNPFAVANVNEVEFRDTTNLLTKAQVAVYPVDARGLQSPTVYNAASSGRRYGPNPQNFNAAVTAFNSSQAAEHTTMDVLAEGTGGRAFYNTNALSSAVSKAIDLGANYYTLTYTPTDSKQDGAFRKIEIQYTGPTKGAPVLTYRHGYYASDGAKKTVTATDSQQGTGGRAATAASFQRAAMSRGAPTPQDLLFTVRVLPAAATTEPTVAAGNQLVAGVSAKGPFRRYAVDYVTLPKSVTLTTQPDGRRSGALQFIIYVFDVDGTLLNTEGETISLDLNATDYAKFMRAPIQVHLEVSAPSRIESFLRIGVRDGSSSRFGVVEVPTSSVSKLSPAVYGGAPKPDSAKPAPAPAPSPATSQPPQ